MAEKTHLKKRRCHLRCFAQLMRNASARFATAKRPRENNVIATDRPDRCHLILSSNAVSVAGQRKMVTGHTWFGKPSKFVTHLQRRWECTAPWWCSNMITVLRTCQLHIPEKREVSGSRGQVVCRQ